MNTPYFLISESLLCKNVEEFQAALTQIWPNSRLAYSIKTNSLPWILKYLNSQQIMSEAVSDEEYRLSKLCGYIGKNIIFNGPIKGELQLREAINEGAIVNIDSQFEVDYICKRFINNIENIGLRINVDPSIFFEADIAYKEQGFRFGFTEENGVLKEIINKIKDSYGECRFGLHLHCNSITRSPDVYRAIASYAANIISKYQLTPSFIDIGGGFFGGIEGKPKAKDYLSVIRKELEKSVDIDRTKLILEPGSAIIGSAVELYTSVLDIKDTLKARIITTDGSRIHIDPLWKKERYVYSLLNKNNKEPVGRALLNKEQVVCGYTCMDHDRLMTVRNGFEIKINDKIIYHRVGAYSVTFGGAFIRYFPDVYVKHGEDIMKVRKRMSVEDYYQIQTI